MAKPPWEKSAGITGEDEVAGDARFESRLATSDTDRSSTFWKVLVGGSMMPYESRLHKAVRKTIERKMIVSKPVVTYEGTRTYPEVDRKKRSHRLGALRKKV